MGYVRGQTATEYLIILSVVIIIALLVVSILGGIPFLSVNTSSQTNRVLLATQDISIVDYGVSDYTTQLTLRNSVNSRIRIDSMTLNGADCAFFYGQKPLLKIGQSKIVTCDGISELSDSDVSWQISITYTDLTNGAIYVQNDDDIKLNTLVGSQYLSLLLTNDYWNSTSGAGCYDASVDPIPICTCVDLNQIRTDLTANYALQNSIDFERCNDEFGVDYLTSPGWEPLGNASSQFSGSFDGQSNQIVNLYINRPTSDDVGLFGYANGATFENLGLLNVNVTGRSTVGSLLGITGTSSYITNVFATGRVVSPETDGAGQAIAGLVGYGTGAIISTSYTDVTVHAPGIGSIGGMLGFGYNPTIQNSYAKGSVTGNNTVGGLIGYTNAATITNSYSLAKVYCTGTCTNTGGLIGRDAGGAICSGSITWYNYTDDDANQCLGDGGSCGSCSP